MKRYQSVSYRRRKVNCPDKLNARKKLTDAIKLGHITKEPCKCGEKEVEGHHEDYSKPLDVEWLCTKCHRKHHRRLK